MRSNQEVGAQLREQAQEFATSSDRLFKLADEIDPPTEEELISRDMEADDDAMWTLFFRVYNVVKDNPGITVDQIAAGIGLPGNYPSENSNHFTTQILHWLMQMGLVSKSNGKKLCGWVTNEDDVEQAPNLRLVVA